MNLSNQHRASDDVTTHILHVTLFDALLGLWNEVSFPFKEYFKIQITLKTVCRDETQIFQGCPPPPSRHNSKSMALSPGGWAAFHSLSVVRLLPRIYPSRKDLPPTILVLNSIVFVNPFPMASSQRPPLPSHFMHSSTTAY